MYKFAVIESGVVQNIIIADSQEIAETVTGKIVVQSEANIGDLYNEETGIFIDPKTIGSEISEEIIDTLLNQPEIMGQPE
jgi:hypothetical protein